MTAAKSIPDTRKTIAIIGNRNAGKSTLLNQITGQDVSIVSNTAGTTTDSVSKAYELIPYGPVIFYDTAGLDDEGELGELRVKATQKIIDRADLILYIIGKDGLDGKIEEELRQMHLSNTAFIPVFNFADSYEPDKFSKAVSLLYKGIYVSAKTGQGIDELKEMMVQKLKSIKKEQPLLKGLIKKKSTVILVTPIDRAAPTDRLILPQVKALREILDNQSVGLITEVDNLKSTLKLLTKKPDLVITDSQVVKEVNTIVPKDIPLTTFSMLYARAKGNFSQMYKGASAILKLKENSRVVIAEGCSHHITCDDIGRVKIPALLKKFTGKNLSITFVSGHDFPPHIQDYDLVIHCGGCMLNKKEIQSRLKICADAGVPITNYGMVISLAQHVLERTSSILLKKNGSNK